MRYAPGQMLDHFRLEALIGHGSMADVYRATHLATGRPAAVKIIHPHLLDQPGCLDRFKREAQTLAQLRHPNIVRLLEFVCRPGQVYLAMEYVGAGTLEAELKRRRERQETVPLEQALDWVEAIAGAVDSAHSSGLIHRDLKPANILLRETGRPVLTDFGLAHLLGQSRLSGSDAITGTPAYLSPEQARGLSGDTRSDIYSLGVILYELLTGQTPFQGNSVSLVIKHISEPPPSPRLLGRYLPPGVEAALMRALAKNPGERYQSALGFVRALRAAAPQAQPAPAVPARAKPAPPPQPAPPPPPAPPRAAPAFDYWGPGPEAAAPQAAAPFLRGMLALMVIVLVAIGGLLWAARVGRAKEPAAVAAPRFSAGSQVRVAAPGQASVSVLRGCPTDFWIGVLGLAGDGDVGRVLERQQCEGQWWYRVSLPDEATSDWNGTGWVDGQYLLPK